MQQVVAGSMMAPTRPCSAPCRVRPFTSAPRPMRAAPAVRQLAAPCRAVTVMSAAPAEAGPLKIRIKLKSYWVDLLQHSVELIKEAADSTGARIAGPVPLPTHRKIYTVLRSPHVNKDSREQFETRLHQRLIDVKDLSAETVDKLMQLDIPAGVDVQVKL